MDTNFDDFIILPLDVTIHKLNVNQSGVHNRLPNKVLNHIFEKVVTTFGDGAPFRQDLCNHTNE